ncbi:large ribosomal subunit protein bL17m [Linepithema humile]|uniref:large ribosomal subunit protein bL17m n=1 Tax=Linepithema humile TaxID=83485 RepID=UPI00062366BB|nr:PREDICTED: 39S ribosomal protein L17, mitochondrial [Linepithema humile]XP_012216980.1 PREDICTED: 39S ribosomal protein L17, mitochondrial [Linepithema humile]
MNQANVEKLVSKLRYSVKPRRRLRNPDGSEGRLLKLRKTLTALIKYERLELNYPRADEARGYVDQLIFEAIHNGPTHKETMDLANYWIIEKQLIHKLFKVLVPRYQNYTSSFTKLHKAPNVYPIGHYERAILELKGNIYPSVEQYNPHERNLLHNLLLNAAKKEYRMEKYKEIADNIKQ